MRPQSRAIELNSQYNPNHNFTTIEITMPVRIADHKVPCKPNSNVTESFAEPDARRYCFPRLNIQEIEEIEDYREGGFHPITIGDKLDNRYTIIHKLGCGGAATVWLAHNDERHFVAIKVVMASESKHAEEAEILRLEYLKQKQLSKRGGDFIAMPIEHFWITGVNGRHICLVSEVAGPSIARLGRAKGHMKPSLLAPEFARRAALQVVQTVAFLHSPDVGVVHGDLTSSNIVLEIKNLDSLNPKELIQLLGAPIQERVEACSETGKLVSAPEFIYENADPLALVPYCTGDIKVIDFGASSFAAEPQMDLATPWTHCPPEYLQDHTTLGKQADIWALACTVWEMRAGTAPFNCWLGAPDCVLHEIKKLLGLYAATPKSNENTQGIITMRNENYGQQESIDAESETKALAGSLESKVYEIENPTDRHTIGRPCILNMGPVKISQDEAVAFSDFLRKAWEYNPDKRWAADELLSHSWLSKDFVSFRDEAEAE